MHWNSKLKHNLQEQKGLIKNTLTVFVTLIKTVVTKFISGSYNYVMGNFSHNLLMVLMSLPDAYLVNCQPSY